MGTRKKQRGRNRQEKKTTKVSETPTGVQLAPRVAIDAHAADDETVQMVLTIGRLIEKREALLAKDHVSEDEAMQHFFHVEQAMEQYPGKWPEGLKGAQKALSMLYVFGLETGYLALDSTTSIPIPKVQDRHKSRIWSQQGDFEHFEHRARAYRSCSASNPNADEGTVDAYISFLKDKAETTDATAYVTLFCMHLTRGYFALATACLEKGAMSGVIEAQRLLKINKWYTDPTQTLDDAMTVILAARQDGHASYICLHYVEALQTCMKTIEERPDDFELKNDFILMGQRGPALFHRILEQCNMNEPWPYDFTDGTRASFLWCIGLAYMDEKSCKSFPYASREKGISLLLKATELRSPHAAKILSDVYNGVYPGFEADPEKRLYWLQKHAEWSGHPNNARDLANRYAQGDEVPANPKLTRKWTKRAARLGDYQAHTMFHQCSNEGCKNQDATGKDFKRCSKCRVTIYCSIDCQRRHWKNGHKQVCQQILEQCE